MPAHTSPYRTADASAATWRQRIAQAMGRRRKTPSRLITTSQIPLARPSAEAFERMDLDQRVRQLGEW